jgi:hypothetical protein
VIFNKETRKKITLTDMTLSERHFQTEKSEQRFVIKFPFLKVPGAKAIDMQLTGRLASIYFL